MHKARAFFYVCAGIFLLALSYHLGARSATAQATGSPLVALSLGQFGYNLMAANYAGDIYGTTNGHSWVYVGNIYSGPVPAVRESFGSMKSRYRGERGAAQPAHDR